MSKQEQYSLCCLAGVTRTTKDLVNDAGVVVSRTTSTCEKCEKECEVFYGSKADAKSWQEHIEKTGGQPQGS